MHPEDQVLVGVVKRKKDFDILRTQQWYRIPKGKAPKGIYADYLAFFLSGKPFKDLNHTIPYYAKRTGLELHRRIDLLPDETKNANAEYHKLQIAELRATRQPITNPSKRRFAFIYTTWDRFVHAKTLDDLYSRADHLVDRLYYALRDSGFKPRRQWELTARQGVYPAQRANLKLLCENGTVTATPYADDGVHIQDDLQQSIHEIKHHVRQKGGPIFVNIPLE